MKISGKLVSLTSLASAAIVIVFATAYYGLSSLDPTSLAVSIDSAKNLLLLSLLLGLALVVAFGFVLQRTLLTPLHGLSAALSEAAVKLDFTVTLPAQSADEMGQAQSAFNQLQSRLKLAFDDIQQSLERLIEATEEVDQSSRKIARNSQVQSDASTNMAAAVEEMTVSISSVASQSADASEHTNESRNIAERSAGVILDTVDGIQHIAITVREAASRIKALRADCDSISSAAKIIREIADQTNLLALNAAIEAARAGEQGRGFAVVADEVRKLAERTTHSTEEISTLLQRMQDSAHQAVESMSKTEKEVAERVDNAREAGSSMEHIKNGAEAAAAVVADISNAMREQEVASASIAKNIEQIAQMSEQNSAAAASSAAGVGKMSKIGYGIMESLSTFIATPADKKIVLRLADTHPEGHPAINAVKVMADRLQEKSQGRITLKIIPGGVFGPEKDELEQLKNGTLDMTRASCAAFNKDCPSTVVPALPYVFSSTEHQQHALDGAPGRAILDSFSTSPYVGLAFFDCGARNVYANKPIRTLADMRDLKLRVMQSDLWISVANALGATPTPLAMEDIITGLKTGLVDASEGNIPTYYDYAHHHAAQYYCLTEHAMIPELIVFSRKRWEALATEDQALISEAARECVLTFRRLWRERDENARKGAQAAGAIIVRDVNKDSFRNAMRPIYTKFLNTPQQKSVFEAIRSMG